MCNSPLHDLLKALPKCEHHMHLEGALTPPLLFDLARKNNIKLPTDDASFTDVESLLARYKRFASLDDFLHYYYIGMSVLITASDFEALAWDYFLHAKADGVVHAEVFFDPQAHLSRNISYNIVVSGFNAARSRAEAELGISSELICCFLRHLPAKDALATFQLEPLQQSIRKGEIIGIGLDSSELDFPPELFRDVYSEAKALGLKRTAHAGEEGPASFIRNALNVLDVQRIDHGIRLAEDNELLARVAKEGVMLTLCPHSNVLLRCVSSISELPIRKFLDAGVSFSLNSDDPAYFGDHYLLDNYCAVQDAFDLSVDEWQRIAENSIRGSWCSEGRNGVLLKQLGDVLDRWRKRGCQA